MEKGTLLHIPLLTQFRRLVACVALLVAASQTASAQGGGAVPCPPNIDWENGDFSNWNYFTGIPADGALTDPSPVVPVWTPTPPPGTNLVLQNTPATDPFGGFPTVAPGGGTTSLRIGNTTTGGDGDKVSYHIHVPVGSNDYSFAFKYAAVFQDIGHPAYQQPTFQVRAYDSATNAPVPCASLLFVASGGLPGFFTSPLLWQGSPVRYCDWTGAALPIVGQGGRTIIIEVVALGCSLGGHFGYAYFDVTSCGTYKAAVSYCNLDSGFVRIMGTGINQIYNWYTSNWQFVGQGFYVDAPVPATPDFFWGVLSSTSNTGCLDTIRTDSISNFLLNATPSKTCVFFGNSIQLDAQTTGGVGGFSYLWDVDPELSDINIKNPTALPNDTTRYFVTVSDKVGCFRRDTIEVAEAPNAGPDLPVCPLGDRPAQLKVYGPADVTFNWYEFDGQTPGLYLNCTDCEDPVAAPVDPIHTYLVTYEGCSVYDTLVVYHDTTNRIETPQDPLLVCRPSFVQLQSVTYGPNPRLNLPCGITNLVACDPADQETVTVGYGNIPAKAPTNTPYYNERGFVKYQFIIPKEEIFRSGFYSGTINSLSLRTLNTVLQSNTTIDQMTISLGCTDQRNYPVTPTNTSFIAPSAQVAVVNNYALTADDWNQIDFTQPYNWDTSKNLLVDICLQQITPNAAGTGTEPIAMVPGVAIQKFDNTMNICATNATNANIRRYYQRPVVRFNLCPTPELPFDFTWRPGTFLSDSTTQNPTVFVQESMNVSVYSVGRNGCQMRDDLQIIHPDHDLSLQPQDTFICKGQPAYMRAGGGADGYQWYQFNNGTFTDASGTLSCTDCPNPTAIPLATTTYAVVFSNDIGVANPNADNYATGCPDTLFTTVNVRELPNVRINGNDTMIKFGQSVPLYALGASLYTWTPSGSLTDPNSPAPIASPAQTTSYIVTGTDSNGCAARDTLTVTIDYHNNLLVPTAFTPNGDGLNDEFKVVNATFQRLMEFRVFNRWGQEVFSTTDIRRGWDGTWKGVPQDMGSFQYIIRVAIPDGNTEMYKGDVTLIR